MTAERDWGEALAEIEAGLRATTGTCRCRKRIHLIDGQWRDDDGLAVCAAVRPGEAEGDVLVLHAPAG